MHTSILMLYIYLIYTIHSTRSSWLPPCFEATACMMTVKRNLIRACCSVLCIRCIKRAYAYVLQIYVYLCIHTSIYVYLWARWLENATLQSQYYTTIIITQHDCANISGWRFPEGMMVCYSCSTPRSPISLFFYFMYLFDGIQSKSVVRIYDPKRIFEYYISGSA